MRIITGIMIAVVIALIVSCASPPSNGEPNKTEGYEVSFHVSVDRWVAYEIGHNDPKGLVIVKNTDSIARTFKVEITQYFQDRSYTKEFTLQIEPGRMKTAMMDYSDIPLADFLNWQDKLGFIQESL